MKDDDKTLCKVCRKHGNIVVLTHLEKSATGRIAIDKRSAVTGYIKGCSCKSSSEITSQGDVVFSAHIGCNGNASDVILAHAEPDEGSHIAECKGCCSHSVVGAGNQGAVIRIDTIRNGRLILGDAAGEGSVSGEIGYGIGIYGCHRTAFYRCSE